ncbi:MAG: hypothetical protein WDO19_13185 [Bacteroidota bacterium]
MSTLDSSTIKTRNVFIDFPKQSGFHDIYFTYDNPTLSKKKDESALWFSWFVFTQQFPGKGTEGYEKNEKLFRKLIAAEVPITPVMVENPDGMQNKCF